MKTLARDSDQDQSSDRSNPVSVKGETVVAGLGTTSIIEEQSPQEIGGGYKMQEDFTTLASNYKKQIFSDDEDGDEDEDFQ